MGAIGSGRRLDNPKRCVTYVMQLTISEFKKRDALRLGVSGTHVCRYLGTTAPMRFSTQEDGIHLRYWVTHKNAPPVEMRYVIPLDWTPCNYGGERAWFMCPECNRRSGILYLCKASYYFLCRICLNLTYESQQTLGMFHHIHKIHFYRKKLQMPGSVFHKVPLERPKYMRLDNFGITSMKMIRLMNEMVRAGYKGFEIDYKGLAELQSALSKANRFNKPPDDTEY